VEGEQEGREEVIKDERRRSILQFSSRKMPAQDIAECLGLDVELVRETLAETSDEATGQPKQTGRGPK
jgi:predicted transposase YdaD